MSLEVSLLTSRVLLRLIPHILLRHLIHQRTVVVLLRQVLHIRILLHHPLMQLVHQRRPCDVPLVRHRIQIGIRRSLLDATLIQELQNILVMILIRLKRMAVLHVDDVPAHCALHRLRHLASLQRKGSLLEVGNHHALAKLTQLAATLRRTLVIALRLRQLRKFLHQLLFWHSLQRIIDAVNLRLRLSLLLRCRVLTHQRQNVASRQQVLTLEAGSRLVIRTASLTLDVGAVHNRRHHHLFLIAVQLLADCAQRVDALALRLSHLQLEVHIQRHILLHRLLVDDPIGVILTE